MYLKNKNSSDYTSQVRVFFNVIDTKFRYSARISDIWALIMTGFGLQQFDIRCPPYNIVIGTIFITCVSFSDFNISSRKYCPQ